MNLYQLALFGDPVSRSLSPGIHRAFGRQFELEIAYQLIQSNAANFGNDLRKFRSEGGHGCNITAPLKHDAFNLAVRSSPGARLAEAANTLWWDSDDQLNADNTDGPGLVRDVENNLGISIQGTSLLILGAGGATAGVLGALLERDPTRIIIANRTTERAGALADRHSGLGEVSGVSYQDLRDVEADIIFDATSLGHNGETPAVPESLLADVQICYSLNYGSAARAMSKWCKALKVPFQDGLGMLVEQAAFSFEIWTGLSPQTDSIYKDLEDAMK